MNSYVVELNDAGITLADDSGTLFESPGYATVDGRRLTIGADAFHESRLNPRHVSNQFWHRLSLDPLATPGPRAQTQADLAFAHLVHIWQGARPTGGDVLFAVPGHLEREQLGLLLGIARECPFRAVGLVDAALAAAATRSVHGRQVLHADTHLHGAVITRLTRGGETLQVDRAEGLANTGLVALRDIWVNQIADAFIRETRFDPLHDAHSEQRLYDALEGWLRALAHQSEVAVELETAGGTQRLLLAREQLIARVESRYHQLVERLLALAADEARPLLLASHRLAALPGLLAALREHFDVVELAPGAAATGTLTHEDRIRSDPERLAFVTRLPVGDEAGPGTTADTPRFEAQAAAAAPASSAAVENSDTAVAESSSSTRATHLLLDRTAYPLPTESLRIGGPVREGMTVLSHTELPEPVADLVAGTTGWRLDPVTAGAIEDVTNGTADAAPLTPGSAVRLGAAGIRLELIEVVARDGP